MSENVNETVDDRVVGSGNAPMSSPLSTQLHNAPQDLSQDLPTSSALPGAELARYREARGWTILEVADQLNLAARQIVALEADNYAALPAIAVVRGFIRAYAKLLRVDPVPLLAHMPANPSASLSEPTQHRTLAHAQFSDTRMRDGGYGKNGTKWYSAVLLLVAVIGGVALAQHFDLLPGDLQSIATKVKAQLGSSGTDAPVLSAESRSAMVATNSTGTSPSNNATDNVDKDKAVLVPTTQIVLPTINTEVTKAPAVIDVPALADTSLALNAATALAKPSLAADAANRLVLNLRDDSWIEIRGAHNTVASKLYHAGATEAFDITEPVQLIVGNAAGVDATLRGAPLVLQSAAKNNVARLNLK